MPTVRAPLVPHPHDALPLSGLEVSVAVARAAEGLSLRFEIRGPVAEIVWPGAATPARADSIWRHTCLECFLAVPGQNAYYEWNASPSGAWAVYRFGGYRERLADPEGVTPPVLRLRHADDAVFVDLAIDLKGIARLGRRATLECAAAAIFEGARGEHAHFALAHAAARPDFHDRRGFLLTLAPATATAP